MDLNLSKRTLTDDVAEIIRKLILNGTLRPGVKINQSQLAEEFVISRGPIREALRLLENEGLINHIPNHGTYVTTLTKKDVYEIYTLRALLEEKGAELALPYLTATHFTQLEAILNEGERMAAEEDLEKLMQIDLQFHGLIIQCSRHKRLIQMHQHLDTQIGTMFRTLAYNVPIRIKQFSTHHWILLEALKAKNPEEIKMAISAYYLNAFEDLSQYFLI